MGFKEKSQQIDQVAGEKSSFFVTIFNAKFQYQIEHPFLQFVLLYIFTHTNFFLSGVKNKKHLFERQYFVAYNIVIEPDLRNDFDNDMPDKNSI